MTLRYYLFLLLVFFLVACGPEAAPREGTSPVPAVAPQASPLIPAVNTQQRSMGNPAAPIVLVEYSDYQ